MNIKCFLGYHDWEIVYCKVKVPGGFPSAVYDRVCLKCNLVDLKASQYEEALKETRKNLEIRKQKAKEIMKKFLEKR